jgi:hypothetical protein
MKLVESNTQPPINPNPTNIPVVVSIALPPGVHWNGNWSAMAGVFESAPASGAQLSCMVQEPNPGATHVNVIVLNNYQNTNVESSDYTIQLLIFDGDGQATPNL